MSAVGTTTSYASNIANLLTTNSSGDTATPSSQASSAATGSGSGSDRNVATRVDLSDKVKAILARASTDQNVADRLKAFVESHRSGARDTSAQGDDASAQGTTSTSGHDSSSQGSKTSTQTDVTVAFAQLSGNTQASDDAQDDQTLQVGKNFATGLKADGYTISAMGRASDGSYQVEIVGPGGKSFLDCRFGENDEFATFGGEVPGASAQFDKRGNTEYITFSQNEAAATSVTASSSGAGAVSATSLGTKSDSVTFAVDFNTGAISVAESESISVSTAVRIAQPTSSFSTIA